MGVVTIKKLYEELGAERNDVKGRGMWVEYNDGELLPVTGFRVDDAANQFVLEVDGETDVAEEAGEVAATEEK